MTTLTLSPVTDLLSSAGIDATIVADYRSYLETVNPNLQQQLADYFAGLTPTITPLFIYREADQKIVTILSNSAQEPDEPGEPGSILAYVRQYGYEDSFMSSDCYGQLSCSSCAVEVLQGKCENPTPRDEEYDMLDIDELRPPTELTRLGCQAVVGTEPLVIKIRSFGC